MPTPRLRFFTPWTPGLDVAWTVQKTRSSMLLHEDGNFESSAMLVDAMGRDDRIVATLNTRITGILGAPRTTSPTAEDEAAIRVAEEVDERIDDWAPRDTLAEFLLWYHMLGLAIAQVHWKFSDSEWIPSLEVWHPQFLRYDQERRVYVIRTREGEIDVDLESGQWLMMTKGERPWMNGAVRSLYVWWLSRQWAIRDHSRYNERHGLPILKAKVPAAAEAASKEQFFNQLLGLSSNTVATLPQDVAGEGANFDLELLEAKDQSFKTFEQMLKQADTSIAVRLLGQNLTTNVEGGSFAAAQVHDRVRIDYSEGDEKDLSLVLGVLTALWIRYNRGGNIATPCQRWEVEPPEDIKITAESITKIGEAIGELKGRHLRMTQKSSTALFNKVGVEVEEIPEDERELPPIPPVAPPPENAAEDQERDDDPDASGDGEMSGHSGKTVTMADGRVIGFASGDDPSSDQGFIQGQAYVDAVGDDAISEMGRPLDAQLKQITDAAEGADSYPDARKAISEAHAEPSEDMDSVGETLAALAVMSALAGQVASKRAVDMTDIPTRISKVDAAVGIMADRLGMDVDKLAAVLTSGDRMGRIRAATIRAQAAMAARKRLEIAEAAGLSVSDATGTLSDELGKTYGSDGSREAVVVRTEAQQTYNRGRWEGLAADADAPF